MVTKLPYSEGEYGHKVRVFKRPGRNTISISYWDATEKRIVVSSLGHADPERARRECRDLSDALRLGVEPAEHAAGKPDVQIEDLSTLTVASSPSAQRHTASTRTSLTWARLFDRYHQARGSKKKGSGPQEDLRRQKLWTAFFEEQQVPSPSDVDDSHIDIFVDRRRGGTLKVDGLALRSSDPKRSGEPVVKDRTIQADLVYLVTVLRWAHKQKDRGIRLLDEVPISVPGGLTSQEPWRPVANRDDLGAVRRIADRDPKVDPQGLFGGFLRLHDGIGWRVTALCNVKASEVSLAPSDGMPYGFIRKNADVDKKGKGQEVPLSRHTNATLKRLLRIRGLKPGDDAYIFPAPKNSQKPWSRWHARDLMNRAEKVAGIAHVGGSHATRRKWVTERKDHPIVDLMEAGGWSDPDSLKPYMHADPDTMYTVVSRPTRKLRRRTG